MKAVAKTTVRILERIALLLVLAPGLAATAARADVRYMYDEVGRLVQVIDAAGNGAVYRYDAAGNIVGILRTAAGQIAIAELSPDAGPVGTAVAIDGIGFSATPTSNTVRFNGTAATVSSATATRLVAVVPAGATTGTVTVTVGANTATSPGIFTVTSGPVAPAPTIASFTPTVGAAGSAVTLAGSNFDTTPANNAVRFAQTSATVTAATATATQIQTRVPTGAVSGKIQVRTPNGSATSAADFIVPPSGYTAAQIGATGRIAVDGAASAFNTGATGNIAVILFDGSKGQNLGLGINPATFTPSGGSATIYVKSPSGADAFPGQTIWTATGINVPNLPATGTYSILIVPSAASSLSGTLILSTDTGGTLAQNGAALTFTTARVGQNGRYRFNATAGQNLSLLWSGASFAGSSNLLYIYKPDGSQLSIIYFGSSTPGGTLDLVNMPATGSYTAFVDPAGINTGQVGLQLLADAATTLAVDGAPLSVSLNAGQNGRYSFNGIAGQQLGLGLGALATTPAGGYVAVSVIAPDNTTTLINCGSYYAPGGNCNLPPLPATGSYTVLVNPGGSNAASLTLTLSTDTSGTLAQNGAALTFSTARVGQNARYRFNATAGQNLSLLWNGASFAGGSNYLTVFKPDGSVLSSTNFGSGTPGGTLDLLNVPTTGSYTVFVDPAGINTGQVGLQLLADAATALAVDGAPLSASLNAGQNGRYSFSGTTGQQLGLGLGALATTPAGGYVAVSLIAPDNSTTLVNCGFHYAPGGNCNLPPLPATGSYTVLVNPNGSNAASLTLTLSTDTGGTLAQNGAALTFATARVGQNGRYSFNATAGQNLSLLWSGASFTGGSNLLTVYKPDGSYLNGVGFGSSIPSGILDLLNVPATGSYTVFVDPAGINTGQVSLQLLADAATTLAIDGAPLSVSLNAGQNGRYSFSGTAGQQLGLGLGALATTPAGGYVAVSVIAPDNSTTLVNCSYYSTPGGSCNLPPLPGTGSYTVLVNPGGSNAASLTLTLSTDTGGTLAQNGAALIFSTARVGQNARYSFNATAGQNLSLLWTGASFTGGSNLLTVYKPDGSYLSGVGFGSGTPGGTLDLLNVPATGSYTVFVDPVGINTGQVGLQLLADAATTLAIDGAPLSVSLNAGQNGRYSFSGTTGQQLGLGLGALATTPAGGYIAVSVIAPDNSTTLVNCNYSYAPGGNCNLPPLPATGSYTVLVNPNGSNAASLTLTLSTDTGGTLAQNGAALIFSTARVGQNARYSFNATAGQNLSLLWSGASFAGGSNLLTVYKPDGSYLNNVNFGSSTPSGTLNMTNVPATGNYVLVVDPAGTNTGQVSVQLNLSGTTTPPPLTIDGSIAVDGGTSAVAAGTGQVRRYSFSGTVGQQLGLGVNNLSTTPAGGYVAISVIAPDNATTLVNCNYYAPGGNCNLPPLPATGSYTVLVNPGGTGAASLTLTLSTDASGTLAQNGAALTFATARIGQNARYSFNATAGQNLSLLWSAASFAGTSSVLRVYRPDGIQQASTTFGSGTPGGTLDLPNLPATGSYTVLVDPESVSTGQVGLQLLADAATTLAIDGAPLSVSLNAGQNGRYSFSGTAGQQLGLGLGALATTPAGGYIAVSVIAPDNATTLVICSYYYAPGGNCNLPPLPATGSYTVLVNPNGTGAASLTLTLSTDTGGTLVQNGAALTFATARVGQNARYSFNATAGQNLSLLWSGASFAGISSVLRVYRPDGTQQASATFGSSTPGGTLDLPNVPATGSYTVLIDPESVSTGQVGLQLLADAATALAIDGAPLSVSLNAGQNGRYSFSGTAGQQLGLGLSAFATTPAGGYVAVSVIAPDNTTTLVNCNYYYAPGGNCNLPPLPGTGNYTVLVNPGGTGAASLTLTLSTDTSGTLAQNGAALTFSTARVGQNARYSFNATAGQNLSLLWSGASFAGSANSLRVYRPDGIQQASAAFGSSTPGGTLDLPNLPATGSYTVLIDPESVSTGQVGLQLLADAATTLAIDGAPLSVSLNAGQNGRYSFSGTAGQQLGLGLGALATVPAGGYVYVSLIAPDNTTTLINCGSYYSTPGGNCNLPPLPATGSYTVLVNPYGSNTASLTLTLSTDTVGTLAQNSAALTFSTARVGQNARYSFNATAGQNLSLLWSAASFAGTSSYLRVYRPDGIQQASTTFGSGTPGGTLDLPNLPATGSYTVLVDPESVSTGQVGLQLLADAATTLAIDGAPLSVSLNAGQNGRYSFNGTAGQHLVLDVSALTFTPPGGYVTVSLITPDNFTTVFTCPTFLSAPGSSCVLPPLPSTGIYTVRIDPSGTYAASMNLALSSLW